MGKLRILTAGESHGRALVGILEGCPAGLRLNLDKINHQLQRRQQGFGRGNRMQIESDHAEFISGIRFGKTLGSPISVLIENKDWKNWKDRMAAWSGKEDNLMTIPRPGHADLAGAIKYRHSDLRNILERASARETAMRVAMCSIIRQFLEVFGIWIGSQVIRIGNVETQKTFRRLSLNHNQKTAEEMRKICDTAEASDVRCGDPRAGEAMIGTIQQTITSGDSLGGIFEMVALNVPAGLGSHTFWDRRLDSAIASDIMGIPGIKAVEMGLGSEYADKYGSDVHDPIIHGPGDRFIRPTNNAGGIEGGMSNGEPIVVRGTMKPIPTLKRALNSVDMSTGKPALAHRERSDACAVPAASVVGEAMLALAIGKALCEKYGGDSIDEIKERIDDE